MSFIKGTGDETAPVTTPATLPGFSTVINCIDGTKIPGPSHGTDIPSAVAEAKQGIDFGNSQGASGLKYVNVDIIQNGKVVATVWNPRALGAVGITIGGGIAVIAGIAVALKKK